MNAFDPMGRQVRDASQLSAPEGARTALHLTRGTLVLVFLAVAFGQNRFARSDPRGTLLVSEAILVHRTVKLDDYPTKLFLGQSQFHEKNGHFYYFFPMGTSLASLPFVALARGFGFDIRESEPELQIVIAAFAAILSFFLLLKLASLFLDRYNALLVASAYWFGTSLASTNGTALWSHDFAVVFGLTGIYAAIRSTRELQTRAWPQIALALFGAYLCRPTMSLLVVALLCYLFTYSRGMAIKAGLLFLVCFGAFVAFSILEFGQVLPDYYWPERLVGPDMHKALYANLLSPARGLLIYSPFIPWAWACWALSKKAWGLRKSWLLVGIAWPLAHWVAISRFPQWWGGYSFGPRLMTDVLPGLFLLTLYTWPTTTKGTAAKILVAGLVVTALFSVFVNSGQGLFNRWTATWNSTPSVDVYPDYVFDWKYPQFLANERGQEQRLIRHAALYGLPAVEGQ
ncbi:MAG TPA: hypothetical protein VLY63_21895 [Anaerolineae bacterium]|nr:hypothetical protein [Anaerolineae bacterium]